MPFTPSHALVALPFIRTPLVPAAIAIGAMTPDLPLFLRGIGMDYGFLHDDANIVWTTLIALALFLLWRVLLRPAVAELSPVWLARRLPGDWAGGPWASLQGALRTEGRLAPLSAPLLVVSLMLGVLSHILWDSFTHEGRWGVELFGLEQAWGPLPGYKWLQYGSSVIALAIIGVWALLRLLRATVRTEPARVFPPAVRYAWWLSLPAVLITAWILGYLARGPFTDTFTVRHLGYLVLPPACAVWGVLSLVLCVVLAIVRRRHQRG